MSADPVGSPADSVHVRFDLVGMAFPTPDRTAPAVEALRDVSLEIRRGEIFGIIGYSGAGKSTLVRLINGLERPTSGTVSVDGADVTALDAAHRRALRSQIGMIFQQFNLFRSRTVAGNVAYPLKVAGWDRERRDARVAELLDFVGLLDRAYDHPEQLSGGQRQRVGIARALATRPGLLLADEATSALDPETTSGVLDLLRRVNRDLDVTIVLITHELDVIRQVADRVAVLDAGRVEEVGDVYDVFAHPRSEAARRLLGTSLHARPSPDTVARLQLTHPGRIITVRVEDDPLFYSRVAALVAARGVTATLVFGGIGELREHAVGSVTFALQGSDAAQAGVLADLTDAGVDYVEETGTPATSAEEW